MDDATSGREPAPTNPARPAAAILNYCQYLAASRIVLSRFCYRRRKTLTPQGPRKLPKLDVAGSTPVARSRRNPVEEKGFLHDGSESSPASGRVPGRFPVGDSNSPIELISIDAGVAVVLLDHLEARARLPADEEGLRAGRKQR